jgi:hypothetical protein
MEDKLYTPHQSRMAGMAEHGLEKIDLAKRTGMWVEE